MTKYKSFENLPKCFQEKRMLQARAAQCKCFKKLSEDDRKDHGALMEKGLATSEMLQDAIADWSAWRARGRRLGTHACFPAAWGDGGRGGESLVMTRECPY